MSVERLKRDEAICTGQLQGICNEGGMGLCVMSNRHSSGAASLIYSQIIS